MTACDCPAAIGPRGKPKGRDGIGRASAPATRSVEVELNGRALTAKAPARPAVVNVPLTITHEGGVMTLANLFVRERP